MRRRGLALDAGGLVVTEPIPAALATLESAGADAFELRTAYSRVYDSFWSGRFPSAELFAVLCRETGLGADVARDCAERFLAELQLVPTIVDRLVEWRELAQSLILVSNHRSEWLRPVLRAGGVDVMFDALYISDELAAAKPTSRSFRRVIVHVGDPSRFLVCDDAPANVAAAEEFGFEGCLVETDARWMKVVDTWLHEEREP